MNPTPEQPQRISVTRGCLLLVAMLALVVRLAGLDQQGLWFDEVMTVQVASLPYAEFPEALRNSESSKPPLFHALVHEWMRFGKSDWWLRVSSALSGAAACVIAALLGAELFQDRRGWWLGLFLAVSPMHVWYSQELRMYALLSLVGFAAMWFHLRFLRTHRRSDLFGYFLFAALTCYAFTYGVFVLGFCVLFTICHRPAVSKAVFLQVFAASALAFLAFVPWVLRIVSAASAGLGFQFVSKGPVHEAVAYTVFNLGFGNTLGPTMESLRAHKSAIFRAEPLAAGLLVAGLLLLTGVLLCGAIEAWRRRRNAFWLAAGSFLCFLGSPAVLTLLKPQIAYNPRYAILGVLPVGVLTLSLVLATPLARWRVMLVALFGAAMGWSLANHFFNPAYWREDMRGAAGLAQAAEPPPARVIVCPDHLTAVFEHYFSGSAPYSGLNLSPPDAPEKLARLRQELAASERWILVYGRTDYGDPRHLMPAWLDENFTVLDRKKLSGLQVFVLGLKQSAAPPL